MVLALFTRLFKWDTGMAPEPGEQYWLGKHKERTPDRSGGCKYYCDRQNIRHGFTTMEGGLSRPGHPHWDGSQGHYSVYN